MRVPFVGVGRIGVVKDVPDWQLPPDAWTRADNIRFRENAAWRVFGQVSFGSEPPVAPIFAMPVVLNGVRWWIYASEHKLYATANSDHQNITGQPGGVEGSYFLPEGERWNGTMLGSIPILNNGQTPPQAWNAAATGPVVNLPNWPSDAPGQSFRCQVMRAFGNYLVALRLRKDVSVVDGSGGTLYPTLLRWSHPADPGQLPASWDIADPTKDAGEFDLQGEKGDDIIDALPLGNSNLIYKAESVHSMSYIGGINIFAFRQLSLPFGMLTQRCAANLGSQHFVVTNSDIVLHNGQNHQSILDSRLKRFLFSDLDPSYYRNSFVVNYLDAKEVWFCYPKFGTGPGCTRALIWNQTENSIGFRDLPGVFEGDLGMLSSLALDTWEGDNEVWSADASSWEDELLVAIDRGVILPYAGGPSLLLLDRSFAFGGSSFTALLERTALRFNAGDQSAVLNSTETVKQIQSVYPTIEAAVGTKVLISVGAADRPRSPVRWGLPRTFTVGESNKVDLVDTIEASKFPAIRFSSAGADNWKLANFEVDVVVVGAF